MVRKVQESGEPNWEKLKIIFKEKSAKLKMTDVERAVQENYEAICVAKQNGYNNNDIAEWLREANVSGAYPKSVSAAMHKEAMRREEPPTASDLSMELKTRFKLNQPLVRDLAENQLYLMQGKEALRIISVQSVSDDNVQYQLHGEAEGKSHSCRPGGMVKILQGPIPPADLEEILAEIGQ